jgi:hypothetical protein
MAPVSCPACSKPIMPADLICQSCGANLVRRAASVPSQEEDAPEPRRATRGGDDGPSTVSWSPFCPHCGADVPDMDNAICVECLRPLGGGRTRATTLRVMFTTGDVECAAGEQVPLGRDQAQSRVAETFSRFDNVSRRHATIGLDDDGRAWVRDERSTNGTFVNDRRLEAGQQLSLSDGDRLRLAADVTGRVRLS